MVMGLIFFLLTGATLSLLLWTGYELFFVAQDNALAERLEGLQSQAMVTTSLTNRRKIGGTGLDRVLSFIVVIPGGGGGIGEQPADMRMRLVQFRRPRRDEAVDLAVCQQLRDG